MEDLRIVFLTHLHTDHTLGLPDLIFTPWIMGRTTPLELYGPDGTKAMDKSILKAYEQDVQIRVHGLEGGNRTGYKVRAHEIKPGVVYQGANIKVTAFSVEHGSCVNRVWISFRCCRQKHRDLRRHPAQQKCSQRLRRLRCADPRSLLG